MIPLVADPFVVTTISFLKMVTEVHVLLLDISTWHTNSVSPSTDAVWHARYFLHFQFLLLFPQMLPELYSFCFLLQIFAICIVFNVLPLWLRLAFCALVSQSVNCLTWINSICMEADAGSHIANLWRFWKWLEVASIAGNTRALSVTSTIYLHQILTVHLGPGLNCCAWYLGLAKSDSEGVIRTFRKCWIKNTWVLQHIPETGIILLDPPTVIIYSAPSPTLN